MPIYTVRNRFSCAEMPHFRDALELYRNQRIRGVAPVIGTSDPLGFTSEEEEAIDLANHESGRTKTT